MLTNQAIKDATVKVAKEYGYENVTANFNEFSDFKLTWERTARRIDFHISDYLADCNEDEFVGLIAPVMERIMGCDDAPYGEDFKAYLEKKFWTEDKQDTFIMRKGLMADDRLTDMVRGLADAGRIGNARVFYGVDPSTRKDLRLSFMFKVAGFTTALLDDLSDDEMRAMVLVIDGLMDLSLDDSREKFKRVETAEDVMDDEDITDADIRARVLEVLFD